MSRAARSLHIGKRGFPGKREYLEPTYEPRVLTSVCRDDLQGNVRFIHLCLKAFELSSMHIHPTDDSAQCNLVQHNDEAWRVLPGQNFLPSHTLGDDHIHVIAERTRHNYCPCVLLGLQEPEDQVGHAGPDDSSLELMLSLRAAWLRQPLSQHELPMLTEVRSAECSI